MKFTITHNNKEYLIDANSFSEARKKLLDMSFTQSDAIDRCNSLGRQFINHFDNIYKNPKSQSVNQWITEMTNWWKEVKQIRLKSDNKPISNSKLHDWFFTVGSYPEDVITRPINGELECYDIFIFKVLNGGSIKESLRESGVKI